VFDDAGATIGAAAMLDVGSGSPIAFGTLVDSSTGGIAGVAVLGAGVGVVLTVWGVATAVSSLTAAVSSGTSVASAAVEDGASSAGSAVFVDSATSEAAVSLEVISSRSWSSSPPFPCPLLPNC
jgi:hypothetical protein